MRHALCPCLLPYLPWRLRELSNCFARLGSRVSRAGRLWAVWIPGAAPFRGADARGGRATSWGRLCRQHCSMVVWSVAWHRGSAAELLAATIATRLPVRMSATRQHNTPCVPAMHPAATALLLQALLRRACSGFLVAIVKNYPAVVGARRARFRTHACSVGVGAGTCAVSIWDAWWGHACCGSTPSGTMAATGSLPPGPGNVLETTNRR
jgi:hypothetical protein